MNQNYSNENRPNGHKQDNKKYRCGMRTAIMRGKRLGHESDEQQSSNSWR